MVWTVLTEGWRSIVQVILLYEQQTKGIDTFMPTSPAHGAIMRCGGGVVLGKREKYRCVTDVLYQRSSAIA